MQQATNIFSTQTPHFFYCNQFNPG